MNIKNEALGVDLETPEPLRQRHVEAMMRALRESAGGVRLSGPENAGAVVRAACEAGIIGLKSAEVDDMPPAAVIWLAGQINDLLVKALTVPGG